MHRMSGNGSIPGLAAYPAILASLLPPDRDRNQDPLVALIVAQNHFPFGEFCVLNNLQYL